MRSKPPAARTETSLWIIPAGYEHRFFTTLFAVGAYNLGTESACGDERCDRVEFFFLKRGIILSHLPKRSVRRNVCGVMARVVGSYGESRFTRRFSHSRARLLLLIFYEYGNFILSDIFCVFINWRFALRQSHWTTIDAVRQNKYVPATRECSRKLKQPTARFAPTV